MKKLLTIAFVFSFTNLYAEIGLKFDDNGHFVGPDIVYLRRAMRADNRGFQESATMNYKKAAEFGNNKAKYFLGLMYLQNKDWPNGYAWLRLVDEDIANIKTLLPQVESLIRESELESSNQLLVKLKDKHSLVNEQKRRLKWSNSLKTTGSRTNQKDSVRMNTIKDQGLLEQSGSRVPVGEASRGVKQFVYNYKSVKTDVDMGEIKEIEKVRK